MTRIVAYIHTAISGILWVLPSYDAILVLSFGGPERREDVMPFLERVTRGRNIPRERLEEVAQNYYALGGKSPINDQCRALIAALRAELHAAGVDLPIYWGNRNWHPLLEDTLAQMAADGVRRAIVFVTSAYSSYSSCRQYLENLERATAATGASAPRCDKLRPFWYRPEFTEALLGRLNEALMTIPDERRATATVLFTAHSVPLSMAHTSEYVQQLTGIASGLARRANVADYHLVWQSRSGPPRQPWLEPDIRDALGEAAREGKRDIVVAPIGFVSDHMEVIVDLDVQAAGEAQRLGLNMVRAATVGTHPRYIAMIRELIEERLAAPDAFTCCAATCCPNPHAHPASRPVSVASAQA